jgi:very-short-patch-repair endonuclease
MAERELFVCLLFAALQLLIAVPRHVITITPQADVAELGYRLDFLVETGNHRCAVEVDGLAFHGSQQAFARDRKRDRDLAGIGIETYRFTAVEVTQHAESVRRELFNVLAAAGI